MNIEDLEELLSDYLSSTFHIETNKKGEVVIYTGLRQDEDGELVDLKESSGDDEEEDDSDFPEGEEDFEPLEDDEDDDDEE